MKKYKFLVIGYPVIWHHSQHLVRYLKSQNYDVVFKPGYTLTNRERVQNITVPADIDFVWHFQFHVRPFFIKKNPKTVIIQYCAETYYSPGAMNPDYLVCAFPEMINRYVHSNPEIFDLINDYWDGAGIFVDPELFDYNAEKTMKGIHYQGITEVKLPYKGAGQYRLYREAYTERKKFLEDHGHLITCHEASYSEDFPKRLSTFEASPVIHAYMSTFAKRPLEHCAAGVINLIYIRDEYDQKYHEQIGFKHLENCFFIRGVGDLYGFMYSNEILKSKIRENALKLLMENYTVEIIFNKILQWVLEHEDPDVDFTTTTQKGQWDFWKMEGDE